MSCDLRPIKMISLRALPLVFALVGVPSIASSQSSVCHPIRTGETATQLARRLTGDGRNKYQPWFQIVDASARFVPKSQYDRIRRGWRACVTRQETIDEQVVPVRHDQQPIAANAALQSVADSAVRAEVPLAAPQATLADLLSPLAGVDLTWVWLGAAVIVPLFGWRILDNYTARRKTRLIIMQHFANRFVSEFERPLIQRPSERPVRSRLRLSPARSRFEILLAPGQGRRYPNLSDHKKNMEYDVVRIQRALADDAFVRDPLYTQAGWVVVPFRFKVGRKHIGVS